MSAHYLNIESKHRPTAGYLAGLSNFQLTDGEVVDADIVLTSPNISLYCLDDDTKRAIFVELPADIDLGKAAFVYLTQFVEAQRLIAVPYEDVERLANTMPPIEHLGFIYTTGRAGSTLLSNAFNELDDVLSLSEVETMSQLVYLRTLSDQRDEELSQLLKCVVRFHFKPTPFKKPSTYILKLQGEVLEIMDLIHGTFPQAKNIFLYRDAVGWVASFYRIFKRPVAQQEEVPLDARLAAFKTFLASTPKNGPDVYTLDELMGFVGAMQSSAPRTVEDSFHLMAYMEPGFTEISAIQMLTLWWISYMEWYLKQQERHIPTLPVRYMDMNAHPEEVLTGIFQYCGLSSSRVAQALTVFAKDSQAGTAMARDNATEGNRQALSDQQRREIGAILQRHPVLKQSDITLPDTLLV